ncbi:putative RNA-directed DNA polymerase from transposon BS [Trichonephila clavipes]|nr:putative RNA-directed DNA polymerase from transposon BS [Trichonephila clavipes]
MKSVTSFFITNRHLYKYQPTVFIKDQKLLYVKHPKYLGFTLDQEIPCNWHIEDFINKSIKRLNILKYISGRDWGADASTLKITYTTLIRPVLEFGSAIFFIASDYNLKKLERIQLSAARIIAGLRNSCSYNLVLYECDLQPLNMRRNCCLTKYFNKLLSYGDHHRTFQYLKHWKDNQKLKRNSPFSQALVQNLSFNVEHHCPTSFINPVLGLQRVTFHYNLMPNVNKISDHPEILKQLALEVISGIPLDAAKIYTDGSLLGNEVADDLAKAATSNPVDPENHMVLTSTEIYSRAKELICRTWVVPPVHPCCQVIYSQFGLAIHQNDHQARRRFVEWAQNEIAVVPAFHKRILFSDETHFWLNGYVNKQNCRIWSEANPQVYVETPLHPEKLTVWCALWAGGIIGPYFFKNDEGHNVTVNGDRYRAMITNFFIPELNNHDVQELWFQQDGATCHTARATIDLLKDTFGDRLISRFGPVNWPPRSCDLTPLDYFL